MSRQYDLTLQLNDQNSARYKNSKLVYYTWTETEAKAGVVAQPFKCHAGDEVCICLEHSDALLQGATPRLKATFQRLHGEVYSPFSDTDTEHLAAARGVTGQLNPASGVWQFLDPDGKPFQVANQGPEFVFTIRITAGSDTWTIDPEMNVDGPTEGCC